MISTLEEEPIEPDTTPAPDHTRPSGRPWYVQPRHAIWIGPLLIATCLALRFGWGGIEGPPFPFSGIAYLAGIVGIFLTYVGIADRGRN